MAGPLLCLLAVALYAVWEWLHRDALAYAKAIYPLDDADEWRYAACSRLVEHGYPLFKAVFSAQPPLLFLSLAGGMHVAGDSIAGARAAEILFGLVALVSTAWLAAIFGGPLAGGMAALLLAVSPGFLVYSHAVEGEGPMMALATLALAITATHVRRRHPGLPLLAGLVLAGAILMKLFALQALLPALWLLGTERATGRQRLGDALQLLAGAMLPVLFDFALVAPSEQWRQVVRLHESASRLVLPNTDPAWSVLLRFLTFDAGLTVLAGAGLLGLILLRRWRDAAFFTLWLPGAMLMLLGFRPLFPHHPAILLTSLAVCAGQLVGIAITTLAGRRDTVVTALLGGSALLYLALTPRLAHADRHVLYHGPSPAVVLVNYLHNHSGERDLVAVDDLRVADEAHRLVVPPLCDPSNVRLHSGYLTTRDLVGATAQYRPRLVLFSAGIFEQVRGYGRWLVSHYRRLTPPGGAAAYVRR